MSISAKVKIYKNGVMQEVKVYNRYQFTERIDGELESGTFENVGSISAAFDNMSPMLFELTDGKTTISTNGYAYDNFSVIRKNTLYDHQITFYEASKKLQGITIDGMAVVQPAEENKRSTLYDVLDRLIRIYRLREAGESLDFTVDPDIISLLSSVKSPEFQWQPKNLLWECLRDIGAIVSCIPKLKSDADGNFTVISYVTVNEVTNIISAMGYTSATENRAADKTASAVYSVPQNVVADNENEASIVYPSAIGWITPRSSGVRQQTDNAQIQLPYPIYKILKIEADVKDVKLENELGDMGGTYSEIIDIIGTTIIDLTSVFVTQEEYNTFWTDENLFGGDKYIYLTSQEAFKNYTSNTIPYEKNSKIIDLQNEGTSKDAGILNNAITSAVVRQYGSTINGMGFRTRILTNDILYSLKFRITYIPLLSQESVLAVKDERQNYEFEQPFNQRTEVNAASAFGRNMKMTAQQLGGASKTITQTYKSLADIPRTGTAYIDENQNVYIIVANEYSSDNTHTVTVTHTLSQNWALLSEYVGMDRAYRAASFSADTVQRNTRIDDYLIFSEHYYSARNGRFKDIEMLTNGLVCQSYSYTEINQFFLYRPTSADGFRYGAYCAAKSNALANSVSFTAEFKNDLSAGTMIDKETNPDSTNTWQKDCFYTEEDGTIGNAYIVYSSLMTADNMDLFPETRRISSSNPIGAYNIPAGYTALEGEFEIEKQQAEILSNTSQCHFVADSQYIFVGQAFAEMCPYVREYSGEPKKRRFIWLKKWLPKTAAVVPDSYIYFYAEFSSTHYQELYYTVKSDYENRIQIHIQNGAPDEAIGWVITTEDNRPLIGCNRIIYDVYGSLCKNYHGLYKSEQIIKNDVLYVHFLNTYVTEEIGYAIKAYQKDIQFQNDYIALDTIPTAAEAEVRDVIFLNDSIVDDKIKYAENVAQQNVNFLNDYITYDQILYAEEADQAEAFFLNDYIAVDNMAYGAINPKVTVKFVNEDTTMLTHTDVIFTKLDPSVYSSLNPTKPETTNFTYLFSGWDPDPSTTEITPDLTFKAVFGAFAKIFTVTVRSIDQDGNRISGVSDQTYKAEYGTTIRIIINDIAHYTKPVGYSTSPGGAISSTLNYTIIGNATLYLTYQIMYYSVKFYVDQELYNSQTVKYGSYASTPTTPTKESTSYYTYTFSGWDKNPASTPITGDTTFNGTFTANYRYYTVTANYVNQNGDRLGGDSYSVRAGGELTITPPAFSYYDAPESQTVSHVIENKTITFVYQGFTFAVNFEAKYNPTVDSDIYENLPTYTTVTRTAQYPQTISAIPYTGAIRDLSGTIYNVIATAAFYGQNGSYTKYTTFDLATVGSLNNSLVITAYWVYKK